MSYGTRTSHTPRTNAGALFIQGLVEGECGRFASEQEKYDAAMRDTDHLAEAHWYKALSLSFEVYEKYGNQKIARAALPREYSGKVEEALMLYGQAKTRRPNSAWIQYDLGCEMVRWPASDGEVNEGINYVVIAANMLVYKSSASLHRPVPCTDNAFLDPHTTPLCTAYILF